MEKTLAGSNGNRFDLLTEHQEVLLIILTGFVVLLAIAWQLWRIAKLSDVLTSAEPSSGGLFDSRRNIHAVMREPVMLMGILVPVRPIWVLFRERVPEFFRRHGNASRHWYVECVIDPNARMGVREKHWRAQHYIRSVHFPLAWFAVIALVVSVLVLIHNLDQGPIQALREAAVVFLIVFVVKWAHFWAAPVLFCYQTVRILFVLRPGYSAFDWGSPLQWYSDAASPGLLTSCLLSTGIENPNFSCGTQLELWALAVIIGFWGLNLVVMWEDTQ